MGFYRKRPVVIQAIQWRGDNLKEIMEFIKDFKLTMDNCIIIPTLEGAMTASINDWIIKGVKGECYPCKPDIFEATYESIHT